MAALFTEEQVQQLTDEFGDQPRVLGVVERISKLADAEPIRSPMGLARSWLSKPALGGGGSRMRPVVVPPPAARGTFRPDGSHNRYSNKPSPTEAELRTFAREVLRLRLSPLEAVDLVGSMPGIVGCFRNSTLASMGRLDGGPSEFSRPSDGADDWLETAWRCVTTCTSAEEWTKRRIVAALAPPAAAAPTDADPDAWRAETTGEGT